MKTVPGAVMTKDRVVVATVARKPQQRNQMKFRLDPRISMPVVRLHTAQAHTKIIWPSGTRRLVEFARPILTIFVPVLKQSRQMTKKMRHRLPRLII